MTQYILHALSYLPGRTKDRARRAQTRTGRPIKSLRGALLTLLCLLVWPVAAAPNLHLTPNQAHSIGERIWLNEGAGKIENLTVWNKGEDFPSFGIGHFIWYPAGIEGPFRESFPQLLQHLKQHTALPRWLTQSAAAPWRNREQFYAAIDSTEMKQLRHLLHQTVPQQVAFIVARMQAALPQILAALPTEAQRRHVKDQFYRVAQQPNGLYALIDYVNFKGEGTSPKERYRGQGWGLLQVLETMRDTPPALPEFVRAADAVLTRRVANAPRDESRWLPGWRARLQTYLK